MTAGSTTEEFRSERRKGLFLAVSGLLLISLDSLGIRLAEAASWDTAFWLGSFTAVSMFVWVRLQRGRSSSGAAVDAPLVASALLQTASTAFFILAINLTAVANVVVIFAAAPVVASLIAMFTIGEATSRRTWLAICGSIVGILIIVSGSFAAGRIAGDLFAVAAIVAFGSNLTLWRRYPRLDRQTAIGWSGVALAAVAFVPAAPGALDARALIILAILGLVTGPAGRVFVAISTRSLSVSHVSLLTPVETIAATAWAWLFLGEVPPTTALIGGVVVIASLVAGTREESQ